MVPNIHLCSLKAVLEPGKSPQEPDQDFQRCPSETLLDAYACDQRVWMDDTDGCSLETDEPFHISHQEKVAQILRTMTEEFVEVLLKENISEQFPLEMIQEYD